MKTGRISRGGSRPLMMLVLFVALAVLAGVSLWLGWAVVVAVVFGVLSFFVLVPFLFRPPNSGAWWDIFSPTRVTRGDAAALSIGVDVRPGYSPWVSAVDSRQSQRVFLDSAGSQTLSWNIETGRRGTFEVGPTQLEFADPFGFVRITLAEREPTQVLVVPRVHPVSLTEVAAVSRTESGSERAGGDSFESVREYVVGDPQKLVHWRSSARAGTLMVRRMVDTTLPWMLVVLDVNARAYDRSASMFDDFDPEAFEQSVDMVASWAWHGCGSQQRVLLTTSANSGSQARVSVEVTVRNRESALDWLAVVDPLDAAECGSARIDALMRRHAITRGVVITGRQGESASPWINTLRRRLPLKVVVGHS